jgi:hypothetical protein
MTGIAIACERSRKRYKATQCIALLLLASYDVGSSLKLTPVQPMGKKAMSSAEKSKELTLACSEVKSHVTESRMSPEALLEDQAIQRLEDALRGITRLDGGSSSQVRTPAITNNCPSPLCNFTFYLPISLPLHPPKKGASGVLCARGRYLFKSK